MSNSDIEACKWLALALNNLQRALKIELDEDYPSSIFYFQQATEFCIKSIIVFINSEPKRSHDPGQQLKALIPEEMFNSSIQYLFDLSAEHSQEYLISRYPGEESPWEIYSEESVTELKTKVITVFKDFKSVLNGLLPNRNIYLKECLFKSIENIKLKKICEEMIQYID